MKRIPVICLLLLSMMLSACSGFTLPDIGLDLLFPEKETNAPSVSTQPPVLQATEGTVQTTTAPTVAPTTIPTETPTQPTEPKKTKVEYQKVDPYPIPIVTPDKNIYDEPCGKIIGTFGNVAYYTIVEQAKDENGYTWGRLGSGEGWTLVYQQILPDMTMYLLSGAGGWMDVLNLKGNGKFSGDLHDSNAGTCDVCIYNGRFRITDIHSNYAVYMTVSELTLEHEPGKRWVDENGIEMIAINGFLEKGMKVILYTPDTPVSVLPKDMQGWSYGIPETGTLGKYGLYLPDRGAAYFNYLYGSD